MQAPGERAQRAALALVAVERPVDVDVEQFALVVSAGRSVAQSAASASSSGVVKGSQRSMMSACP